MTTRQTQQADAGTASVVDLAGAVRRIAADGHRAAEERVAESLFQSDGLGAVLTSLRSGAAVHNAQPDEATLIQGLSGECLLSVNGDGQVVDTGTLVGIAAGLPWRLVARTDAVVLLTVSRPELTVSRPEPD
jgi:quercetin dioxygenase-like cupin family protein